MTTRKILAILLALSCLLSTAILLTSCFGAPAGGGATLEYTLTDDGQGYFVSGIEYDKNAVDIAVEIPETYEGLPVTAVGDQAFLRCYALISVSFPASVSSIGKEAFRQTGLETVIFHENGKLTDIGQYAFADSPITEITIPSSVIRIGEDAFSNCNLLATVNFAENSNLELIGARAFWTCGMTTITFPKSLTVIESNAFNNCGRLESVAFEEGSALDTIWASAFNRCRKLKTFTVPASTTYISSGVFYECAALQKVIFEDPTGWRTSTDFETSDGEVAVLDDPAANAEDMKDDFMFRWRRG